MPEALSRPEQLSPLLKQSSTLIAVRGEGMYLYGADGRRYLDFSAGIGVTSTGHCHPKVVAAAQKQAQTLIHGQYTTLLHPALIRLTERLSAKMPKLIDTLFYASAGTEAVEGALRLCRHATGRSNIIVFHGGFHGRTMGALSLTTSGIGMRTGLQPMMGGVIVAPFPHAHRWGWSAEDATRFCLRELDYIFATYSAPTETAAMFIEPMQGEGGYVPANRGFMQGLRERCDRHGILLVLDEVQTGYGRTGRFWAHEHFELQPDIVVTAKGIASGFPLSAFGAPRALMAKGLPGSQGGTYGGNAVACAAALATLDVIEEEGLVENAAAQGGHLISLLRELQKDHPEIGDVRGLGLMLGTEIVDHAGQPDGKRAERLVRAAERRGLLMIRSGAFGGQVVRWLPPLIVKREHIEEAVSIFREALDETGRD
jgi:acetylornithine aminotransferase/4-aminobutyrate aminotransferase